MGIREKTWKKYNKDGTVIMTVSYKDDLEDRVNGIKVNLPERNVKLIR
jgi:antitoxin component YwqK of YwqJK toxin-antitoxin module